MKQENNNSMLDALFQQARNAEPVFSEKDAKAILNTKALSEGAASDIMHDTQLTPSLTTTSKLIITKGTVMMSTLGLGIASAFTYYLLSSTTPAATERPIASNAAPTKEMAAAPTVSEPLANTTSHATYVDDTLKRQRRIVVIKKDGIDPSTTSSEVAISKAQKPIDVDEIKNGLMKNIDVEKVTPIEVNAAQLSTLGIEFTTSGGVSFQQRHAMSGQVTAYTLSPSKSVVQVTTTNKEFASKDVPTFGPRIVTTLDGKKRFMQYSTTTSGLGLSTLFSDSAQAHTSVVISQGESGDEHGVSTETTQEITSNDGKKKEINVNRTVTITNTSNDSLQSVIVKNTFSPDLSKINVDSIVRSLGIDPAKAHGNMKIAVQIDDGNLDKGMANENDNVKKIKIERIVDSITSMINPETLPVMIQNVVHNIQANAPDPNTLVPILIKNKNGSSENSLIFWYEPADVQALVNSGNGNQASLEVKAPHGAINELSIYPNPARNEASVKFNLKDARTVSFAIHNLLGQKVQEVQTMPANPGSGEVSVNVSSLEPGLYLLVLSTDKGEQMIKRLVVER